MSEISDLFAKDPLLLTRDDRAAIIAKFREDRAKWQLGQRTPKLSADDKKAAKALEGPKKKVDISSIKLEL